MNNIILCGFMGCGKSTVGRTVARKTGRRFLDMDRYIETKAGKTIPEIFDEVGEEGFRDLEHEACAELAQMSNIIIASGGGAFTFDRNVEVFRGVDKIVLLDVPLDVIKRRKRLPKYHSAADIVIKGGSTPLKTAQVIINALKLKK